HRQRLEREDIVDQVVVVEAERRAALDVRPVLGRQADEWPRAETLVVEVDSDIAAEQPAVTVAIRAAGIDLIRVNIGAEMRELMTSDAEVERRPRGGPVFAGKVDAPHREVVRVIEGCEAPFGRRR